MKNTIIIFFAATIVLLGCKQAGMESLDKSSDPSSELDATKSVLDYGVVYPIKTTAGFSKSKKCILDAASSFMQIKEKSMHSADLLLKYVWRHGQSSVWMDININDVPFQLSEDGSIAIEAQGIPGSVTYSGLSWTEETVFQVDAVIGTTLEGSKLNVESDALYLDIEGFSSEAEEKTGTWIYIDPMVYELNRFINSMNSDITIDLGEYKVASPKKNTTYELTPVTLAPGEVWEFDYCSDSYPNEGYYYGLPATISIHYAGEEYRVKKESIVPMKMDGEWKVFDYETETEYNHSFQDGFLFLSWYPIYIYRITPEVLGL